ncbi:hypothetical protein HPB50_002339 [Hyalomma asiaticum]|uniref:Uncharacterized protein n=1 Tax=Hyalomma asiaticum TaxID=266040 RepID=A0ACB7S3R5_HYAAI|nr:hypothetical protein HPB50_002339 [Hyalomma asiaticum]
MPSGRPKSPPLVGHVPVDANPFNEADMMQRVETCLNRRQPLFEAGYPADETGSRIFSSRPPSSLSAKEILRNKVRNGEQHSSVLLDGQRHPGTYPYLNSPVGSSLRQFDIEEAYPQPGKRSSTSFLHRSELFSPVKVPTSRHETASKRGLGRLSRALLQVDSVSVQYGNRTIADAGIFRRLFGGYQRLERTKPQVCFRAKSSGSVGCHQAPAFARPHQSLRLLVTVAFLLVAFLLASGLFATKHGDSVPRRNKDMSVKHDDVEKHTADNITTDGGSADGKSGNALKPEGVHKRIVALEGVLVSPSVVTSFGCCPDNDTVADTR